MIRVCTGATCICKQFVLAVFEFASLGMRAVQLNCHQISADSKPIAWAGTSDRKADIVRISRHAAVSFRAPSFLDFPPFEVVKVAKK